MIQLSASLTNLVALNAADCPDVEYPPGCDYFAEGDVCDAHTSCQPTCVPKFCKLPDHDAHKILGFGDQEIGPDHYVKLGSICAYMQPVEGDHRARHDIEVCCEVDESGRIDSSPPSYLYDAECVGCSDCKSPQFVNDVCCKLAKYTGNGRDDLNDALGRDGYYTPYCSEEEQCCKCAPGNGPESYMCVPHGYPCESCLPTTMAPTTESTTAGTISPTCVKHSECNDGLLCDATTAECKLPETPADALIVALRSFDFYDPDIDPEIPPALFDVINQEAQFGLVSGSSNLVNSIFTVPDGAHLLSIEGTFIPDIGISASDMKAKIFGLDGLRGMSDVDEDGTFAFTLTEMGPGANPYFIIMTRSTPARQRYRHRHLLASDPSSVCPIVINNEAETCSIDNGTGYLSATLKWDEGTSDIDLHTYEPSGDHVYYGSKNGTTGSLDVDDVDGYGPENYFSANPQTGTYTFRVRSFDQHFATEVLWDLEVFHGQTLKRHDQGIFYSTGQEAGPFEVQIEAPERKMIEDPRKTYPCPPVKTVKWYCVFCPESIKYDISSLDAYNTVMELYDDSSVVEAPAKAITLFFANKDGKVGSMNDEELQKYLLNANNGNDCVRSAFEDAVCYTLYFSDYFTPKRVTLLKKISALNAFRTFTIGVATGNPLGVASSVKKLMTDVIIPAMDKLIGSISFLFRGDPCSRLYRSLLQCEPL